jgi:outer membrane protein assembly factor BamB
MRRAAALALTLTGLTVAGGQTPTRVLTNPSAPPQEVLDRLDLEPAWRTLLPVDGLRDGIGVVQQAPGQIFVRLRSGILCALDATTGALMWTERVGEPYPVMRRMGIGRDTVLVLDAARIVALDRATGRQEWDLQLDEVPITPPSLGDFLLYINYADGRVATYSLPKTTAALAKLSAEERSRLAGRLSRARSVIGSVAPLAPVAGDPLAVRPPSFGFRNSSPVDMPFRIGTSLPIRGVYLQPRNISAEQAREISERPIFLSQRTPGFPVNYSVIAGSGVAVATGTSPDMLILRLDPENPISRLTLPAPVVMPPVQSGRFAFLVTADATVQAVDLLTGAVRWRSALGSRVLEAPLATTDALFVVTESSGLVRIDLESGAKSWIQPDAKHVAAVNPRFVYANDRVNRLLVLSRAAGVELGQADFADFNVGITNDETDRLILAANNGLVVALRDRHFPTPVPVGPPQPPPLRPSVERGRGGSGAR